MHSLAYLILIGILRNDEVCGLGWHIGRVLRGSLYNCSKCNIEPAGRTIVRETADEQKGRAILWVGNVRNVDDVVHTGCLRLIESDLSVWQYPALRFVVVIGFKINLDESRNGSPATFPGHDGWPKLEQGNQSPIL